jgi:hypothetical protein
MAALFAGKVSSVATGEEVGLAQELVWMWWQREKSLLLFRIKSPGQNIRKYFALM